jgi:hypothetical protein
MNILDNGIHLAQTMSFDELDRCLDLITYYGAKTLNVEDQYGIEEGTPANFLVRTPIRRSRLCASALTCWHRSAMANTCSSVPSRATRSSSTSSGRPGKTHAFA